MGSACLPGCTRYCRMHLPPRAGGGAGTAACLPACLRVSLELSGVAAACHLTPLPLLGSGCSPGMRCRYTGVEPATVSATLPARPPVSWVPAVPPACLPACWVHLQSDTCGCHLQVMGAASGRSSHHSHTFTIQSDASCSEILGGGILHFGR